MSVAKLENLLKEISPEHPSGELDLEHDPDFMELEKEFQGVPEVEVGGRIIQQAKDPDWGRCADAAVELLGRTHDLRIAVYLARALLHTEGIEGFYDGLKLIRGYVQDYWDTMYPRLDPDDGDPFERVNALEILGDWDSFVGPLMKAEICSSRTAGSVSLRQFKIASGKASGLSLTTEEVGSAPNLASIAGAFTEGDPEQLRSVSLCTSGSVSEARLLEKLMNEKAGSGNAPDLSQLIRVLKEMDDFVRENLPGSDAPSAAAEQEPEDEPGRQPHGQKSNARAAAKQIRSFDMIESRGDVLELLEQVCAYYELFEPASPVPLLLRRAMRLVTMNFMEIIQDLAPDSVPAVTMLCGTKEQ